MGTDTRVLITGAGGQIGSALGARIEGVRAPTRVDLDVTDASMVARFVSEADVVIHCAAFTDVDGCESDPQRARRVNTEGTRLIAEAARRGGSRVVYLSTDYVFDGQAPPEGGYSERDATHPINEYGRSKLAGEPTLAPEVDLIVRTSWVFGQGRNFVSSILRAAEDRREVRVVDDQRGRPTSADAVADAVVAAIEADVTGVVHVAGDGDPCTWADLAETALGLAGIGTRVARVTTAEYAAGADRVIAPRPPDSSLSLERARDLGLPLTPWRDALVDFVNKP